MVFFEAIQAFISLDLGFFIDVAMDNLLWVFIFFALIYYFNEGKRVVFFFVVFSVLIWSFIDFDVLTGLTWNAAGFLLIYYLTKISVLAIAEKSEFLKNKLYIVSEVQFISLLLAYTFFMK